MTRAHLKTRTASTSTVSDTTVAGAALTHAELDSNLINLRDSSWGLADDTSTVLQVSDDKTITIAGGSGISTAISGDTLTITASESQNVFNTISVATQDNIVADATTDTLTLVGGNDITITTDAASDTITIASTASGTITALNNQAENRLTTIGATTTELDGEANLTFDGSTLAITGAMTATTSIANDAVSIDDNVIKTTRSNDNLNLETNGTGQIQIRAAGGDFANFSTSNRYDNANTLYREDLSDTIGDGVRHYGNAMVQNIKLTSGQNSSNSSDRWRNSSYVRLDLNGSSSTATSTMYRSRGPMAMEAYPIVDNTSATNSALGNASGGNYGVGVYPSGTGDITITSTTGMGSFLDIFHNSNMDITITDHIGFKSIGVDHYGNGAGNFNITDHYGFYAGSHADNATATLSLTNNYGYYFADDSTATNQYAFYSANDTAKSRVGSLERYREEINTLTSDTTISVDCGLAPVHKITLGHNTEFNISNLGTGQTATLIITQDGTGSRTATFGTDGSTAVKFAGGTPTLSTDPAAIDVITVFNDGTNYLGNIAQAFAA